MKSFLELTETQDLNAIDVVDASMGGGVHNLQNPEVLLRINGVIGSCADEEFVNPLLAVRQVREHLSHIGVGFLSEYFNVLIEDGTVIEAPLYRWGGRYGRLSDESAEMMNDDGISYEGKPLSIKFGFSQMENNRFVVTAKII